MGHITPTNVFAWTGEQINEQHNAIAAASFFTRHPPSSASANAAAQASSAAIPPARQKSMITPTPLNYKNSR
jgi:hypothetical protein